MALAGAAMAAPRGEGVQAPAAPSQAASINGTAQLHYELLQSPLAHFPRTIVNHVGYRPDAGKVVLSCGLKGVDAFSLINTRVGKGFTPVYRGKLRPSGSDLGVFLSGDFSEFKEPGSYRISAHSDQLKWTLEGGVWSHTFTIGADVLDDPIRKAINFYRGSSCGPSKHGFNTPCHVGPIQRDDGGESKPIHGGFHSAHDFQRDASETLHALFGLVFIASARPDIDRDENLIEEIRWGNDYWHAVQSPEGFLCVGVEAIDYFNFMKFDWWDSAAYKFTTKPAEMFLQHNFVDLQALIARHYRQSHPEYASRCLEAGRRCLAYVREHPEKVPGQAPSLNTGTGVYANVQMFRVTGDEMYRTQAREMANRLVGLQTSDGYWVDKGYDPGPSCMYIPLVVIGLASAARHLSDDPDRDRWMKSLEKFVSSFVKPFSEANAFGIMPGRFYENPPPQPARTFRGNPFRYFIETNSPMSPGGCWQTGNNATVAGYGVAMLYISELLDKPWLRRLAQRQLDWVLGVNSFDASMMLGVGRGQPPTYTSKEVIPPIADIRGAILQGPIGDDRDFPVVIPGYYSTCEYWQPHHAWVSWLMAELSTDHPAGP
jgi:hypothetical protein